MSQLPVAQPVRSTRRTGGLEAIHHAPRRTCDYDGVQSQDGNRRGTTDLRETLADCGVSTCLDQRALRLTTVPVSEPPEGSHGSHLGVPQLQPDKMVQHTTRAQSGNSFRLRPRTGAGSPAHEQLIYPAQTTRWQFHNKTAKQNPISSQLPVPRFPSLGFPLGSPPLPEIRAMRTCPSPHGAVGNDNPSTIAQPHLQTSRARVVRT